MAADKSVYSIHTCGNHPVYASTDNLGIISIYIYICFSGKTALHLAAYSGKEEALRVLLDAGDTLELQDINGQCCQLLLGHTCVCLYLYIYIITCL